MNRIDTFVFVYHRVVQKLKKWPPKAASEAEHRPGVKAHREDNLLSCVRVAANANAPVRRLEQLCTNVSDNP